MKGNDMAEYEQLLLKNQLCFPLYACSKEIVRKYTPFLDPFDITYTQYITMMALWEMRSSTVKELGEKLWLDSGTLTPVLKKLETKGYIERKRSTEDERSVLVSVTDDGYELREKVKNVPFELGSCVKLSAEDAAALHSILYKILEGLH